MWYWQRDRCINEWDIIQEPKNKSKQICPIHFWKWSKCNSTEGENIFNKYCWNTEDPAANKPFLNLIPYVKINSKWIIDLNIKHETIKLLEKNVNEYLWDLGLSKELIPKAQFLKIRINKLNFIKMKYFCSEKSS